VQRVPLYRRDLNIVAVAPDGELAAICTVWFDDVTRTAVLEPVGTHPEHQKRGLGKAVMSDGLRRAERLGATLATVSSYGKAAHAIRSQQVVEVEILPRLDLTTSQKAILLEAIELHDYRDMRAPKSNEALLLREADMLEFLGAMGLAREFARGPKNAETCYKRVLSRRDGIQWRFTLPRAQEIAQVRFVRMNAFLKELEEESLGVM
jgi:GNAT superfamily N-acetyltransferase